MSVIVALSLTKVRLGTARFQCVKNKASSNAFYYVTTLASHPVGVDLYWLLALRTRSRCKKAQNIKSRVQSYDFF